EHGHGALLVHGGDAGHDRRSGPERDVRELLAQQRGGDGDRFHGLQDAASAPMYEAIWTAGSTSPPPACLPSRYGRTRSPTISPTPQPPATRPTARLSSRSARCCSATP